MEIVGTQPLQFASNIILTIKTTTGEYWSLPSRFEPKRTLPIEGSVSVITHMVHKLLKLLIVRLPFVARLSTKDDRQQLAALSI